MKLVIIHVKSLLRGFRMKKLLFGLLVMATASNVFGGCEYRYKYYNYTNPMNDSFMWTFSKSLGNLIGFSAGAYAVCKLLDIIKIETEARTAREEAAQRAHSVREDAYYNHRYGAQQPVIVPVTAAPATVVVPVKEEEIK